jgi:hypothetical protein
MLYRFTTNIQLDGFSITPITFYPITRSWWRFPVSFPQMLCCDDFTRNTLILTILLAYPPLSC